MAPKSESSANPSDKSPPISAQPVSKVKAIESEAPPIAEQPDSVTRAGLSPESNRRWSFPGQFKLHRLRKPSATLSTVEKHDVAAPSASETPTGREKPPTLSSADRRAKQSALIVRSLIVGQDADQGGLAPSQIRISSAQLKSVKSQLLKPKTACKVFAQLRALPALPNSTSHQCEPIQAVCLPYTDEEADKKYSSLLRDASSTTTSTRLSHVAGATIESAAEAFRDLHVVSLFTTPDFGLGQPGDRPGLLAGAVPTAETVIRGITQITPQLMALGYATGKAVNPNHEGIYPPTDRISVLTYWWGLELLLPPPTLEYLSRAQSISATIMNFLTALGVMSSGVREILPFVRYFSQFIDFEFNAIKAQDHGKGVICSATWIMPAALVPRPWDFPDPPKTIALPTQAAPLPVNTPAAVPAPTLPSQPDIAPLESPASPSPATQNPAPVPSSA
ncbi:hypothetical protein BJV74DRAFT_767830 [Russula compacta]|nr:hypothetical protein BJV74DRAFT_767830 [Russula compacta]